MPACSWAQADQLEWRRLEGMLLASPRSILGESNKGGSRAMVRNRISQVIKYGLFKEALEAVQEVNQLCRAKGLPEATYWSPLGGANNTLVIETEYESLAEFERDGEVFYSDADVMTAWRRMSQYIIEGSGSSEVLMSAPELV
jgi:hypothetical protein